MLIRGLAIVVGTLIMFAWLIYSVERTEQLWARIVILKSRSARARNRFHALEWEQLWFLMFFGIPARWVIGEFEIDKKEVQCR